jgi:hypothetical protein
MVQADSSDTTTLPADPMPELVRQHRRARRAISGLIYAIYAFEETVPNGPQWSYATWQPEPPEGCTDPPTLIALNVALREAYERDRALLTRMLSTEPTSYGGLADLMAHLALSEFPDDTAGDAPDDGTMLTAALEYPDQAVVAAARAFPKMIAAAAHTIAASSAFCGRSTEVAQ